MRIFRTAADVIRELPTVLARIEALEAWRVEMERMPAEAKTLTQQPYTAKHAGFGRFDILKGDAVIESGIRGKDAAGARVTELAACEQKAAE